MTGSVLVDIVLGLSAVAAVYWWIMHQLKSGPRTPHCSHVSDGNCYMSDPPQWKCKNCGMHFRYSEAGA